VIDAQGRVHVGHRQCSSCGRQKEVVEFASYRPSTCDTCHFGRKCNSCGRQTDLSEFAIDRPSMCDTCFFLECVDNKRRKVSGTGGTCSTTTENTWVRRKWFIPRDGTTDGSGATGSTEHIERRKVSGTGGTCSTTTENTRAKRKWFIIPRDGTTDGSGATGSTEHIPHIDTGSLDQSECAADNESPHPVDGLQQICEQCDRENEDKSTDEKGPPDSLYIMRYIWSDSPLKVGRARDVEARARQLEAGHCFRLQVLAIFPGKGYIERKVHEYLSTYRVKTGRGREWFKVEPGQAFSAVAYVLSTHDPLINA
jgi:hypothetical protein